MKRIAFFSTMSEVPWGGSEVLWSRAAQRLAGEGVRVAANTVWWPQTPGAIAELRRSGVRWFPRKPTGRRMNPRTRVEAWARTADWQRRSWLRRFGADFMVISQGCHIAGHNVARVCRKKGIPYAMIVQSASEGDWPDDGDAEKLAQAYENAAMVFFVADENRKLTETQLGLRLPRFEVVWNPFQVDYDARPPWPDESGELRLACVGRLEPRAKGQDLLFGVLRREKWRNRPVSVSLFGHGGNAIQLQKLARRDGLDNVHFAGFSTDIEALWSSHHALVLPSRYEGTPLVVVEAMLCGRPCIVTPAAGRNLVSDGASGFVAQAPTVDLLDDAMERAWQQRDSLKQLGQRAASSIRDVLPRDPVGQLAEKLLALCP